MAKKFNLMIIWKALAIGVLILLMLIPLAFVRSVIKGRLEYKKEAVAKIAQSWGGHIVIAAPVLNIPFSRKIKGTYTTEYAKFAPKDVNTDVNVISQKRYIGIFEVPVFEAEITMRGNLESIENIALANKKAGEDVKYNVTDTFISLEINDLKGISALEIIYNGKKYEFCPTVVGKPLSLNIPEVHEYLTTFSYTKYSRNLKTINLKSLSSKIYSNNTDGTFEIKFSIKGSNTISFVPLAKDNSYHIYSKWTNPNFSGAFLPYVKDINSDGFLADYKINYMASGISQDLKCSNLSDAIFSVSLLVPVDNYRSAERAVKYGILFIILTFIACFVWEITSKKPIHPFQYILVGLAMAVFYILLISISEFVTFGLAYIIASTAIILMITLYIKFAISKNMTFKQTGLIALSFVALYGYLYILLLLQDMALLFGGLGLFVGLAIMMYTTRNINWYDEAKE
jgi:inner membrane protein